MEERVARVVEDADEEVEEDAELVLSLETLLDDAVGVGNVLKLSDPESVEDSTTLVDSDSEAEDDVSEPCDTLVSVCCSVADAVTSLGRAVTGGAAVAGPNSEMK